MSSNLNLSEVASNQNQKEITINDAFSEIDGAFTEKLTIDLTTAGVTLTPDQWTRNVFFACSGHTVARTVIFPGTKRLVVFRNAGTANVTLQVSGGGSAVLVVGSASLVYCDGTNLTLIGGSASLAFTDLTDTFATYKNMGGLALRVKPDQTGVIASNYPNAPKAADFTVVSNRNPSVMDSDEGLVVDGGTPAVGDVCGGVFKAAPAGEFEVKARMRSGNFTPANWKMIGLSVRYNDRYIITGVRQDSTLACYTVKNANAGSHIDCTGLGTSNYATAIAGVWGKIKFCKPKPGNLAIAIFLATAATNCTITGWTTQQTKNAAGASGSLCTLANLATATSATVACLQSVASNSVVNLIPINSTDGVTIPSLRGTDSDSSTWVTKAIALPAGSQIGDACVFGVRHQFGVMFDDWRRKGWKLESNFNGINGDGSACHFSKVLTADDIAAGVINVRATQSGAGCHFIATIQAGTFSSIGISQTRYNAGTSFGIAPQAIEVLMSPDDYWWTQTLLEISNAYLAADPSHVGFAAWFNNASVMSMIVMDWKQSW